MHSPRHVLITGGAGFIGCNLVRYLLATDASIHVIVLDALTYAGSLHNLHDIDDRRHHFVQGDICDTALVRALLHEHAIDTILHLAAESHVDRSIDAPAAFIQTNIAGTASLLEAARAVWGTRQDVRFHHVSTDEVFGDIDGREAVREDALYAPSSPYAASKAGADHLVRAWARTYGLPVSISNCGNNYGPYQFPEKLLPLLIHKALAGEPLPIYGDGQQVRDWVHVEDHCRALQRIVTMAPAGSSWNVSAHCPCSNLELVHRLLTLLETERPCPRSGGYRAQISHVVDRPGHDRRYALDARRLHTELDWQPHYDLNQGLRQTVQWYLSHEAWMQAVMRDYDGRRLGLSSTEVHNVRSSGNDD